jgi:hypothetical protein
MNEIAPIILFVYNRLDVLIKTIDALSKNTLAKDSTLYIFSDGAKNSNDIEKILKVREFLKKIKGFKNINIVLREYNIGLVENITSGVSQVLELHEKSIVLEDDIITSPFFLQYMNDCLNLYKDNDEVCQISGYSYLEKYITLYNIPTLYFIKGADCLAWGTWKRAWRKYSQDSKTLANEIKEKNLIHEFNRNGAYNFYELLLQNSNGKKFSWAINWYAVNFLSNKFTLYPLKSFAQHIGANQEATNYLLEGKDDPLIVNISLNKLHVSEVSVTELKEVTILYNSYLILFKNKVGLISRFKILILKLFNKF